ncbi:MAG: hypothetical protein M3Q63_02860 [bacterium]|nr:hypothetical protein [bacterium]
MVLTKHKKKVLLIMISMLIIGLGVFYYTSTKPTFVATIEGSFFPLYSTIDKVLVTISGRRISLNIATTTPSRYPLHKNITATVFWVGEPVGNGSSEDNALSAWDDEWQKSYGGYDDYVNRNGYYPAGFIPKENPFYVDVPYNDFDDDGNRKPNAYDVVPWAHEKVWGEEESMMKNRWVKITKNNVTCYGQNEDAGPYEYDDYAYVFGTQPPKNKEANNAGMDISPALRDCLTFEGLNTDSNKVDWQFIDEKDVPEGPWKTIVITSQINWK